MKRYKSLIALLVLSFLFVGYNFKEEHKILKIGKKAPLADKKMKDISDKEYSLEDLKEKNGLLVVFSCNTCPFVVGGSNFAGWEKDYNDIYEKCQELGIGMVLINSNEAKRNGDDSLEKMKKHASDKGYKMKYVVDKNHVLADAFGAKTTPHIFLFDKDLKLIYTGSIDNSWDGKRSKDESYLENALFEVKNGKSISTTNSSPRGCSIKRI